MSYLPVEAVHVFLEENKVGRLALIDRRIYFEYDPEFIHHGLEISPYKLPLKAGAVACKERVFEGLFGVFNDSLPDGWGRLLLDRQVRRNDIAPEQLTPLDRLTHVGAFGMGALRYEPDITADAQPAGSLNLDQLASESSTVLEGESNQVFEHLLSLAGSSAGARPKVMIGANEDRQQIIHGQQLLPDDFRHWLVKFPARADVSDIGAVEYAYSVMAKAAGISMPPTHLFPGKEGAGYFGVQRFDRTGNQPLHMHSLSGYLHADHRLPSLDYRDVLKATWMLTKNLEDVKRAFRLAVFNILSHNRDDHAKNFAFLMQADGSWELSPAYDLTFSSGPGGEQSTIVMGEGKSPGLPHLRKLADAFDLPDAEEAIVAVREAVSAWSVFAREAGVGATSRRQIEKVLRA